MNAFKDREFPTHDVARHLNHARKHLGFASSLAPVPSAFFFAGEAMGKAWELCFANILHSDAQRGLALYHRLYYRVIRLAVRAVTL
jgi:hypothetical protein